MGRTFLTLCLLAAVACNAAAQPVSPEAMPLSEIKAGQHGEVWTVFEGTKPEPFEVEVSGVILNALGPGKSIILCKLTDPRVQNMGAVAGMSGSPLYIDGKFAGALSYQIQRFETVRYAGFTPALDMAEVADRASPQPPQSAGEGPMAPDPAAGQGPSFQAMKPVFALGGVSPRTAEIMTPQFATLGLGVVALGGNSQGVAQAPGSVPATLQPGDAVSVALTTGDISLAGTGTVSRVDGNRIVAFGHPMMSLGDVQFPMCSAEVVAILPSSLESFKIANVGPVIGCITQDRLSAVSGVLGAGPEMTDVLVVSGAKGGAQRKIRFQVIRDVHVAPMIMLTGVVEGLFGSNDNQPAEGFRIVSKVSFSPTQEVTRESIYAGEQGFQAGMFEFLIGLTTELENPFEKTQPKSVEFRIEPLEDNPAVTVERFQVSRTMVHAGDSFQVTLGWRNFQGSEESSTIDVPVNATWTGKTLEVIVAPGRLLDELTGHSHSFHAGQLRSFDAYIEAMRSSRPEDGLCIAVVEKSALFFDQAAFTPEAPASIERIAGESDSARYQKRDALVPLWETRVLQGKVSFTEFHKTVRVVE
jgi:SpoIVB peptidase S55